MGRFVVQKRRNDWTGCLIPGALEPAKTALFLVGLAFGAEKGINVLKTSQNVLLHLQNFERACPATSATDGEQTANVCSDSLSVPPMGKSGQVQSRQHGGAAA